MLNFVLHYKLCYQDLHHHLHNDRYDREVFVEIPSRLQAKKLVVYLHGTNANGDEGKVNLNPLVKHCKEFMIDISHYHFIAPHGPELYDGSLHVDEDVKKDPSSRQWVSLQCLRPLMSDIKQNPSISIDELKKLHKKHHASLKEMQNLLEKNVRPFMEKIKQKQKELNLINKDTIIMGFSQGAMLGLYLTLSQKDEEPFSDMLALSGCLVAPSDIVNTRTRIWFLHGKQDAIIPVAAVDLAKEDLIKHAIIAAISKLKDVDHFVMEDPEGFQHVAQRLVACQA